MVGTLPKNEFEIYDNGAKQQIAVFEHQTDQPLSVILMVDTSGSTAKELKYEADSASRFFHALLGEGNLQDSAALYTFNWEIREQQPFTRDLQGARRASQAAARRGGNRHVRRHLSRPPSAWRSRQGRKVIVVVTDGGDTVSKVDVHKALEAAQMADAVIYAIVVMPITNDAGRNIGGEHALEFMAKGTGGRTFHAHRRARNSTRPSPPSSPNCAPSTCSGIIPRTFPSPRTAFINWRFASCARICGFRHATAIMGRSRVTGGGSAADRITISPDRAAEAANKKR